MKKVKITEEQRQFALKEGLTVTTTADNGDVGQAARNAQSDLQKAGADPNKATIQISPKTEGRIITKRQMMESRLKALKANSEYFTVNDFIKRISKK